MIALLEMRSAAIVAVQFAIGAAAALILGKMAVYGIVLVRFILLQHGSLATWSPSQQIAPQLKAVQPYVVFMRSGDGKHSELIIILKQMHREIPLEMSEGAEVDGTSRLEMFSRIPC